MVRVLNFYVEAEEADEDGVWGYRAKISLGSRQLWQTGIVYRKEDAIDVAEEHLAERLISLLS